MRQTTRFFSCAILATLLAAFQPACSGTSNTVKSPAPNASDDRRPQDVDDLASQFGKIETQKGTMLFIDSDRLGKEFLLQSSFAIGDGAENPTPWSLKSRIVTFKDDGDRLILLDVTGATQPGTEYSVDTIVTSFPIAARHGAKIIFDFNDGMKIFLTSAEWYASDNGISPENESGVSVVDSFIRNISSENELVEIDQALSVIVNAASKVPLDARYFISPYVQNSSFAKLTTSDQRYIGYFETNPKVEPMFGTLFTYITRWDISKPVTWSISSAVPSEYREAVKEGLLYWNKAFGREVIKVDDAPEDITAPDISHNIVQWHTTQNADAYAYANAQYDPRSGEIVRAQVYIPSSFAYNLLKKSDKITADVSPNAAFAKIFLTRSDIGPITETAPEMQSKIGATFSESGVKLNSAQKLKVAQDYVRILVAHEVGHALGLRHNFSGSTESELTFDERESVLAKYLATGELPSEARATSNSVMDYQRIEDELINSEIIRRQALNYDRQAIEWAYFRAGSRPEYTGLSYCLDSEVAFYSDCQRFDAGANPFDYGRGETAKLLGGIPSTIVQRYITAKADLDPLVQKPIAEATPSISRLSEPIADRFWQMLLLIKDDVNLNSIYDKYPSLGGTAPKEIENETKQWINAKIAEAGGIRKTLEVVDPEYFISAVNGFNDKIKELIESESVKTITRADQTTTSFNEEEKAFILAEANNIFDTIHNELAMFLTEALTSGGFKLIDDAEGLEDVVANWANFVLTNGEGAKFTFKRDVRLRAARLLKSSGPLPEWLDDFVPAITKKLGEKLTLIFGMAPEQVDVSKYERREREWIQEELNIYSIVKGRDFVVPIKPMEEATNKADQAPTNEDSIAIGGGMIHILKNIF